VEAMTREQIDAIERLYAKRSDSLIASGYNIPELLAAARRALELEEALEWAAMMKCQLRLDMDGTYSCAVGGSRYGFEGATALEAIQNARRGHGG